MQRVSKKDIQFMRRVLRLAARGRGKVHPNPLVGALLVKNNRIIGEGAHRRFGGPHAEVHAIENAVTKTEGAVLYVNLEPCPHYGKTPPCVELILKSKIREVCIAQKDPNPRVAGRGIRALRRAGVKVRAGILEAEAVELNKAFNFWVRAKRPYVFLKVAQSLDGKIATAGGDSRWITGAEARRFSHRLRASVDAILVGINTVIKDDPRLTVRMGVSGQTPLLVVLDSALRISPRARIFSQPHKRRVLIAATQRAPKKKIAALREKAEVVTLKTRNGRVDLDQLLAVLGRRGIASLLVEGGGEVSGEILARGLANEIYCFIAPTIIGGRKAVPSVGGPGAATLRRAWTLKTPRIRPLGRDWLLQGKF